MVVKTLTITEETYNKMKRLKRENESFSDLFNRLADEKLNIASRFRGLIKMSEKEVDEWRKSLAGNKKLISELEQKKEKKLETRMRALGI
jgi:predicted CopG family antitoxin